MILVTGATGKTGRAILRALSARGSATRALVHRSSQEGEARRLGAVEAVAGDLLDPGDMARALDGVRAMYLIAPNVHSEEVEMGKLALRTAKEAGVERVVYHSVLHPQIREMPHHWKKLQIEELLIESGLEFTILQPAAYMQNVTAYWEAVTLEGAYRVPYGEGGALSLVDLEDVAEVAARSLTEPGYGRGVFELAGPEALSPSEIARVLGRALGRTVRVERMAVEEWVEEARQSGLDEYSIDALARMFRHYDRHGLRGNPAILETLLGRRPVTFADFAARSNERATGSSGSGPPAL